MPPAGRPADAGPPPRRRGSGRARLARPRGGACVCVVVDQLSCESTTRTEIGWARTHRRSSSSARSTHSANCSPSVRLRQVAPGQPIDEVGQVHRGDLQGAQLAAESGRVPERAAQVHLEPLDRRPVGIGRHALEPDVATWVRAHEFGQPLTCTASGASSSGRRVSIWWTSSRAVPSC